MVWKNFATTRILGYVPFLILNNFSCYVIDFVLPIQTHQGNHEDGQRTDEFADGVVRISNVDNLRNDGRLCLRRNAGLIAALHDDGGVGLYRLFDVLHDDLGDASEPVLQLPV